MQVMTPVFAGFLRRHGTYPPVSGGRKVRDTAQRKRTTPVSESWRVSVHFGPCGIASPDREGQYDNLRTGKSTSQVSASGQRATGNGLFPLLV